MWHRDRLAISIDHISTRSPRPPYTMISLSRSYDLLDTPISSTHSPYPWTTQWYDLTPREHHDSSTHILREDRLAHDSTCVLGHYTLSTDRIWYIADCCRRVGEPIIDLTTWESYHLGTTRCKKWNRVTRPIECHLLNTRERDRSRHTRLGHYWSSTKYTL